MTHLAQHIKNTHLKSDNTLHVVGVVSNPSRHQSRVRLARAWADHMKSTPNVKVHLVESAFGDRHHELDGESFLNLRTSTEIWNKESMINLGVRDLLPRDWRYVAWVDTDVEFRDPNWAQETLHELQHVHVVQPWQHCADLGAQGSIMKTHKSFGYTHHLGPPNTSGVILPYSNGHTGYAWACTRRFWEAVGGLLDFCVLGSGDHHMAWAMVGCTDNIIHRKMTAGYQRRIREWEARAMHVTNGQIGFTHGRIEHSFHGPKARRYYQERWQILVDHGFDPDTDLIHDEQGLIKLVGKPALEQAIRNYNRSRSEDSIEE